MCGNGIVQVGEECDGGVCCTEGCTFRSSLIECRPSVGPCDAAEKCSGSSSVCSVDIFHADG